MKKIIHRNQEYTIEKEVRNNDYIRDSFNKLTKKTYGFDFEDWNKGGYWQERYLPYVLMDDKEVISNVSVNIIDFMVLGEKKTFVQLGTVMTEENHQGQGLNRLLMDEVIKEWQGKCDVIYLFANEEVLEFYPKFGFREMKEYVYKMDVNPLDVNMDLSVEMVKQLKWDMSVESNRKELIKAIESAVPCSKLAMIDNSGLIMFYLTSFMSDCVYYIKELNAFLVAEFDGDTLEIMDVYADKEIPLEVIVSHFLTDQIKQVVLGFTPLNTEPYQLEVLNEADTTLFVLEKQVEFIDKAQLRFPVLSHA